MNTNMNNLQYAKIKFAGSKTKKALLQWSKAVLYFLQKEAEKREQFYNNCFISELELLKTKVMDMTGQRIEPEPNHTWNECYVPEDHLLQYHLPDDSSGHAIILEE